MTSDKLREDAEWEEYTIRVKKDPAWPYHGSDIEFNGMKYIRADIARAADEKVKALVEAAYKSCNQMVKDGSGMSDAMIAMVDALAQLEGEAK